MKLPFWRKTLDLSSYSTSEGVWEDFDLSTTFFPGESGKDEAHLLSINNEDVSYSSQKEHIPPMLFSG